jgi:hypothetical protein
MELVPDVSGGTYPRGVQNGNFILSYNSVAGTVILSRSIGTRPATTYHASNTFYGNNNQFFAWKQGFPVLACAGSTATHFTINGCNFGPTAFQGSPAGSHDCVTLTFMSAREYTPTVTITNDAFIMGATCTQVIGSNYGMITVFGAKVTPIIHSNFIWGRNADPCCLISATKDAIFLQSANYQGRQDLQFNFVYQIGNLLAVGGRTETKRRSRAPTGRFLTGLGIRR